MTKRNMVERIAAETGIIQSDVASIVQRTLDRMADELAAGRDIELRNFGVFKLKRRKSRLGRNPNKPKNEVIIPEHMAVKFCAGKERKERVGKIAVK